MAKKKTSKTGKPPKSREGDASPPPASVAKLVERFDQHADAYRAGKYNETQIRREFIDPLFKALGWDVDNSLGYAEAYKDVIHEDAIKIGGATKAPDYCFRIGGTRKFFVEAKKPSIDIKGDPGPAYQLRRYAWSAKLPLSILTDFEEFAVYDCRIKPSPNDKSSKARTIYFRYDELLQRWNELASIFSRDAILKGSFDKYADSTKKKRGTAEVDDAFLAEIEQWRDVLARNIALRNKKLSQRELNFAVQRTIDRIVFLRICEDRGIEQYGTLLGLVNGKEIYQRLFERFRRADERYNSGLFHFSKEKSRPEAPDDLTPNLSIDDKPLKDILKRLYYPDSPYEFSVLPADILGQVYEQFLGKVIELSAGHRATVVEKPEVRKAGGVYYTPTYIVDYIVQNTVGKLVEGKSPLEVGALTPTYQPSKAKDARPLTVLDPACGSGSFLLGAYQFLLDWYRDRYAEEGPDKHTEGKSPRLFQHSSGEYRLTIAERKRILLSHIYGVDIDTQAVEVTKLSLLLKVLEGESSETIGSNLLLFHERALPDLADNIKCGNSLIGPDFYDNTQMDLFDEEERLRVNVFEWQTEFNHIMAGGGFDAVIGNPPYIDSEWMTNYHPEQRKYCTANYLAGSGNWDIFCVFIERASKVAKNSGYISMIVPNKLGSADYATGAREVTTRSNTLINIRDYSAVPVFPVSVYPIVFVALSSKPDEPKPVQYQRFRLDENSIVTKGFERELDYERYFGNVKQGWAIFGDLDTLNPVSRILKSMPCLADIAEVNGAATVAEAYELKNLLSDSKSDKCDGLRVVNSGTIDRYQFLWGRQPMRYIKSSWQRPIVNRQKLSELPPRRLQQGQSPKLIVAGMTKSLEVGIDLDGNWLAAKSTSIILNSKIDLHYLIGILNSKLIDFTFRTMFAGNALQGGYLRIGPPQLKQLPIKVVDRTDMSLSKIQSAIEGLVANLLGLYAQFRSATGHATTAIQRQIEATDRKIDQLVYELYNLTAEEIAIVEAATE